MDSYFNPTKVVDSFRLEEILEIHGGDSSKRKLVDIIPIIHCRSRSLESWLSFWRSKNIAYAVNRLEPTMPQFLENRVIVFKNDEVWEHRKEDEN